MFVFFICGAFSSKSARYAAFGEALKHVHDLVQQAPLHHKLVHSVVSYEPRVVNTRTRFQLTLTVTEEWPASFHIRIDHDQVFDGYLDSGNRPTANFTWLDAGGHLLYVSFNDGETWLYLGQIKVESNWFSYLIPLVLIGLGIFIWLRIEARAPGPVRGRGLKSQMSKLIY